MLQKAPGGKILPQGGPGGQTPPVELEPGFTNSHCLRTEVGRGFSSSTQWPLIWGGPCASCEASEARRISLCHMNAHPLWTADSSPAPLVLAQWTSVQSGPGGMDRAYSWYGHRALPLMKVDLLITPPECLKCQKQRPTLNLLCGTISQGNQGQVDSVGPLPTQRDRSCPSLKQTHNSGFGFAVRARNASASTTIRVLTKRLIHHHSVAHNIASNQGIHFSAKEVWQQAQACGIPLVTYLITQKQLAQKNGGTSHWRGVLAVIPTGRRPSGIIGTALQNAVHSLIC